MSPILGIWASAQQGQFLTAFDSIATVTVGAGGSSSITFSSIPSTYTHLQIRAFNQTDRGTYNVDNVKIQVGNGSADTGSNYAWHQLYSVQTSPGTSTGASSGATQTFMYASSTSTGVATSTFGAQIIDILDYKNTNKYKTIRVLGGSDTNGAASGFAGFVEFDSGLWQSTSAIDTIKLFPTFGTKFNQYSHFALFGIKGA